MISITYKIFVLEVSSRPSHHAVAYNSSTDSDSSKKLVSRNLWNAEFIESQLAKPLRRPMSSSSSPSAEDEQYRSNKKPFVEPIINKEVMYHSIIA